jgi:protein subunit release factor B
MRRQDVRIEAFHHQPGSYWLVVARHLPTGAWASCARFRTRIANKFEALRRLEAKVKELQDGGREAA